MNDVQRNGFNFNALLLASADNGNLSVCAQIFASNCKAKQATSPNSLQMSSNVFVRDISTFDRAVSATLYL